MEETGKNCQFDIRHKTFSCLNPLDGVLVDVKAEQLQPIGQSPLRKLTFFSLSGDYFST